MTTCQKKGRKKPNDKQTGNVVVTTFKKKVVEKQRRRKVQEYEAERRAEMLEQRLAKLEALLAKERGY